MNPTIQKSTNPVFLVRWRGYAVKFHTNACGKNYSLVADAEASVFDSMTEAVITAKKYNLRPADVKFKKVGRVTPCAPLPAAPSNPAP